MAESRSHKTTAMRIARQLGAEYNPGKGADINASKMAVEVETPETVQEGIQQLQGYRKPVYIAVTTKEGVEKALEATQGTTVGVMNNQGEIVKKSTRRKG